MTTLSYILGGILGFLIGHNLTMAVLLYSIRKKTGIVVNSLNDLIKLCSKNQAH